MTPDLQNEFAKLSKVARARLKSIAESGSYRRVFSFWAFPSFTPSFCWTVYAPLPFAKAAHPFAEYTVWRSDLDLEKLSSPVERLRHPQDLAPTIEAESVSLAFSAIEAMESTISDIAIPLCLRGPSVVGLDGTRYEFQYGRIFFSASLEWWESHPEEWRPFTAALVTVVENLDDQRKKEPNQEPEPTAPSGRGSS
jgi:hypothetical protein